MILELTSWRRSSTEIMSSNISDPLPNKYDNPSEKVRKQVGIWMKPKRNWSLLLTRLSKEGILTCQKKRKAKPNLVKEAIITPISEKKNIDTLNKTDKSQAYNKTVDSPRSNKNGKVKSLDKSRSTQKTDT